MTATRGYVHIAVGDVKYYAHRLAWYITHGTPPKNQVDHIDGNPSNNRVDNLREATQQENNRNMAVQANNTSGAKGVSWSKSRGKWVAQISHRGKQINVGRFTDFDDAVAAVTQARINLHGRFARHS